MVGGSGLVYWMVAVCPHSSGRRTIRILVFLPPAQHQEWMKRTPPHAERARTTPIEGQRTVGGIRALLIAPLAGAFMGLIGGGISGGCLIAIYFLVALRPFGPGGWWPILPLDFHSADAGFSTKNPIILIPWRFVVETSILLSSPALAFLRVVVLGKTPCIRLASSGHIFTE